MKPLLSLCLLVCDEAKSIKPVLESLKPFIDCFTVIDTGSRDNTRRLVLDTLEGIPGYLYDEPFRGGFAAMRNRVIELDKKNEAIFNLTWSGDEFLRKGEALREYLETQRDTDVDCHFINLALESGMSRQARILRTGSAWKYDDFDLGIHEVPVHPTEDSTAKRGLSTGGFIEHIVTDPIGRTSNIWENHIPKLRDALGRNPENSRAMEFLIQSLEVFLTQPCTDDEEKDMIVEECRDLYIRRFALPFPMMEQRTYFVMRFIDLLRFDKSVTPEQLFTMADELCKADGSRPEPFLMRAVIAAQRAESKTSEVYQFAREAASIAEKVRLQGGLNNSSPFDLSTEWQAHRLAAVAAMNLAQKHPEQLQLAKDHIAAGTAVGGPWRAFADIVKAIETTETGGA